MDIASAPGTDLFVTTALTSFEAETPSPYADDVVIDGRCHRRLDPRYYAWLRLQMIVAKNAAAVGRLAPASFDALRSRFNAVHAWAVARFGADALAAAVNSFTPKGYESPRADVDDLLPPRDRAPARHDPKSCGHIFPLGNFPFWQPVTAKALLKVDNIRELALARDWTEAGIFQNRGHLRFPYGGEWGLICFVEDDDTLGNITRESITIHRPRGSKTRFPNPNVEQPWLRRTEAVRT